MAREKRKKKKKKKKHNLSLEFTQPRPQLNPAIEEPLEEDILRQWIASN